MAPDASAVGVCLRDHWGLPPSAVAHAVEVARDSIGWFEDMTNYSTT